MDIDLTNPQDANVAANEPTLTKEFIPSLGVTEIPDFETFSLDPDKYLSQVVDPSQVEPEGAQEVDTTVQTQMETEETETLPPVDGAQTQEVQTQSTGDMPGAEDAQPAEGSEETPEDPEKETLQ